MFSAGKVANLRARPNTPSGVARAAYGVYNDAVGVAIRRLSSAKFEQAVQLLGNRFFTI